VVAHSGSDGVIRDNLVLMEPAPGATFALRGCSRPFGEHPLADARFELATALSCPIALRSENSVYVELDLPVSHVQIGALGPRRGRYMSSVSATATSMTSLTRSWALPSPPRCLADMSTERIA
jgi:hypothetical protein